MRRTYIYFLFTLICLKRKFQYTLLTVSEGRNRMEKTSTDIGLKSKSKLITVGDIGQQEFSEQYSILFSSTASNLAAG